MEQNMEKYHEMQMLLHYFWQQQYYDMTTFIRK